ncbi:MAG: hypothetical protein ACQERC_00630 [Bacteroidota bacterium]
MKRLRILTLFIGVVVVFSACSDKADREVKAAVASFVSNHEETVGFGYVDVNALLDKSELSELPAIGSVIRQNSKRIGASFDMDQNLFYALGGPLSRDGTPERVFAFAQVKNADSLKAFFNETGYFFEEENGKDVYYDMTTAIGIADGIVVVVTGDFDGEPKESLMMAFEKSEQQVKGDHIPAILNEKTDVLVAAHLKNLYATSNTSLTGLPEAQKKEIEEMANGSFYSAQIDFEKGALTVDVNTNRVSDKLREAYFFNENSTQDIVEKIGPGAPVMAMATNMDVAKMEQFMNRFSPQTTKRLYRSLGMGGFVMQALTADGLASVVNGQLGVAVTALPEMNGSGAMIPALNAYVKMGENRDVVKELVQSFAKEGEVEALGEGFYRYQAALLSMEEESMILHSNDSTRANFRVAALEKKEGMESFGEEPFHLFVDLKEVNRAEMVIGPRELQLLFDIASTLTIDANNEGAKLRIELLDKEENVLKQLRDAFKNKLQSNMPNFAS